jgi:hypothetical protein
MIDQEIQTKVLEKLTNVTLPRDLVDFPTEPVQGSATPKTGAAFSGAKPPHWHSCSACDENNTEFSASKSGKTFPFHTKCFQIYGRVVSKLRR